MTRRPSGTVVVVGPVPPPVHGAARVTDRMRQELGARSARVVTVDTSAAGPDGASLRPPARLLRLAGGLLVVLGAVTRGATVYVGGAGGPLLWYQAIVLGLARLLQVRTVFHHHSYSAVLERRGAMRAVTRLGGPSVVHVTLGETMAEDLRRNHRQLRDVRVCSNAALLGPASPAGPARSGDPVLGHLSNLSMAKGLGDVVAAFECLLGEEPGVRLVLAGPPADDEAAELLAATTERHGDRVEVLGRIGPEQVEAFYRRIDVFCFPSRYAHEAEPLVVLDALRFGVPTVAYDVGCLAEVVPPAGLVEQGGDYPCAVARTVRGDRPPVASLAELFARRRDDAQVALGEVVGLLVGR